MATIIPFIPFSCPEMAEKMYRYLENYVKLKFFRGILSYEIVKNCVYKRPNTLFLEIWSEVDDLHSTNDRFENQFLNIGLVNSIKILAKIVLYFSWNFCYRIKNNRDMLFSQTSTIYPYRIDYFFKPPISKKKKKM